MYFRDILSVGTMAKRRRFIVTNFTSSAAICSVRLDYVFFLAREEATGEGGRGKLQFP
jgi:hypothetical protein